MVESSEDSIDEDILIGPSPSSQVTILSLELDVVTQPCVNESSHLSGVSLD
jgi:hypothetical protein